MIRSILIVQRGFLGDAILASGLLRTLAAAGEMPEIGFVVRSEFAELFHSHPALAHLHPYNKKRTGGYGELVAELRSVGYDAALIPHRSLRSAMLARSAGIARRVGFRQSAAPLLLTDRVEYSIAMHETKRNTMLLQALGSPWLPESILPPSIAPWLVPSEEAIGRVRDRFSSGKAIITIAPGSVWPTKRWTVEGYSSLAGGLADRGYLALLAGSKGERGLCNEIADAAQRGRTGGVEVVAGELSIAETLALVSISDHVVSNDSAPLHLAESVGTPVTAIFGPTVPEFGFAPQGGASSVVEVKGLACRPCRIHGSNTCPIGTHECMTGIDARELLSGFERGGG